jgi:hypothetical protein
MDRLNKTEKTLSQDIKEDREKDKQEDIGEQKTTNEVTIIINPPKN